MKVYCSIVLVVIACWACSGNHHSAKEVNRFTFAMPSSTLPPGFNEPCPNCTMQVYRQGKNALVILDAEAGQSYDDLMKVLENDAVGLYQFLKSPPLERIYKLDQKEEYPAQQGQLVKVLKDTKRYVLTLEIVNDPKLREEYKRVHGKGMAWPEITNNMKQVGIKDMEIYLEGYQAFLIMDTKPDFDLEKDGSKWSKLPREAEWQAYVAKFQKVNPESKATEKWKTMKLYQ